MILCPECVFGMAGQGYLSETGITVGYVGVDDFFVGYFCLGDRTRGEASEAVRELKVRMYCAAVTTLTLVESAHLSETRCSRRSKQHDRITNNREK